MGYVMENEEFFVRLIRENADDLAKLLCRCGRKERIIISRGRNGIKLSKIRSERIFLRRKKGLPESGVCRGE